MPQPKSTEKNVYENLDYRENIGWEPDFYIGMYL